jgi:transposase
MMRNMSGDNQIFENEEIADGKFLTSHQRQLLLKNLQTKLPPEYRRRLKIMLLADMGKSQSQICEILGCSPEMARYWSTFVKAGMADKWQENAVGRPRTINEQYIERLKELVAHSPRKFGYAFTNWTAEWLSKHLATEFGIKISQRHINRLLKKMGLSTKSKCSSASKEKIAKQSEDISIIIYDLKTNVEPCFTWSLNFWQKSMLEE